MDEIIRKLQVEYTETLKDYRAAQSHQATATTLLISNLQGQLYGLRRAYYIVYGIDLITARR